ncbi:MAG TPA: AAA family ATPase [Pirellulales bacterium]|nr:AAA family ATPase [Pirellulales bacterium]
MPESTPLIVLLGGPNGAGKSTTAPSLLPGPLKVDEFVNADVIAQGLSAFQPQRAALEAGRVMLRRLKGLANQRASFAFESTLASRSFAPWIAGLRSQGYEFALLFLWLHSPDHAVARVAERVKLGGHDVPETVIRRRYVAGLRNFFQLYQPMAKVWRFYDNSRAKPNLIAAGRAKLETAIVDRKAWSAIQGSVRRG